jgi:hypothetical protein
MKYYFIFYGGNTMNTNKDTLVKSETDQNIDAFAQAIKENETRVEKQRMDIYWKERRYMDMMNQPTSEQTVKIKPGSFDAAEIEGAAQVIESKDIIWAKICALDDALAKSPCFDRQFLDSIREYLKAIRPVVKELEEKQWDFIRQIEELNKQARQCEQEYKETTRQINDMLNIAHISCLAREYDKLAPMNGLWGITWSLAIIDAVDRAIKECDDGEKYAIGKSFSTSARPIRQHARF